MPQHNSISHSWAREGIQSHHNFSLPFATHANVSLFFVRYRRLSKVNLRFIVCFSVVMGYIVESFTSNEGSPNGWTFLRHPCQASSILTNGSLKCMILSLYGFILTPFWHHLAFWFYSIFVGRRFLFRSTILASLKCIAAMNFIYSLHHGSLFSIPILYWKFMMREYSKIWTFFLAFLLCSLVNLFSCFQQFSLFFILRLFQDIKSLLSPFKLFVNDQI